MDLLLLVHQRPLAGRTAARVQKGCQLPQADANVVRDDGGQEANLHQHCPVVYPLLVLEPGTEFFFIFYLD